MPDIAKTLPEQIIETSRAFTQTLEMENAVLQAQLNGAIEMTIHAFHSLITLCKEAVAVGSAGNTQGQQNLANIVQEALSDIQKTTSQARASAPSQSEAAPANTITDAVLDSAVLHSVALSYENAVTAQQQVYITQQAAAVQIISTILSVATATLGIAVKETENGKP